MNNSEAFKTAHKITKAVIQKGDDYKITFGESLKLVMDKSVAGVIRLGLIVARIENTATVETEEVKKLTYIFFNTNSTSTSLKGDISRETDKAICLKIEGTNSEMWFPKKALIKNDYGYDVARWFKLQGYAFNLFKKYSSTRYF